MCIPYRRPLCLRWHAASRSRWVKLVTTAIHVVLKNDYRCFQRFNLISLRRHEGEESLVITAAIAMPVVLVPLRQLFLAREGDGVRHDYTPSSNILCKCFAATSPCSLVSCSGIRVLKVVVKYALPLSLSALSKLITRARLSASIPFVE